MKYSLTNQLLLAAVASLTLGLAPFKEPHLFGKIKWLAGGAKGMKAMDWFDLFMHGTPWIYLFVLLVLFGLKILKTQN